MSLFESHFHFCYILSLSFMPVHLPHDQLWTYRLFHRLNGPLPWSVTCSLAAIVAAICCDENGHGHARCISLSLICFRTFWTSSVTRSQFSSPSVIILSKILYVVTGRYYTLPFVFPNFPLFFLASSAVYILSMLQTREMDTSFPSILIVPLCFLFLHPFIHATQPS